jgi:hypothetical protein
LGSKVVVVRNQPPIIIGLDREVPVDVVVPSGVVNSIVVLSLMLNLQNWGSVIVIDIGLHETCPFTTPFLLINKLNT